MLLLVREVKKSVNSDLSMAWLKPFMTERKCRTGEVLFYKHEKAEEMFYIVNGRFRLVESGIELPNGAIVGELGMLSPSNKRTQTLECIEGGLVLSVTYQKVEELYVQNPEFGFYFLQAGQCTIVSERGTARSSTCGEQCAGIVVKVRVKVPPSPFRLLKERYFGEETRNPWVARNALTSLSARLPADVVPIVSQAVHS